MFVLAFNLEFNFLCVILMTFSFDHGFVVFFSSGKRKTIVLIILIIVELLCVCSLKDYFFVGSLSNICNVFFFTLEIGRRITYSWKLCEMWVEMWSHCENVYLFSRIITYFYVFLVFVHH